MRYGTCTCSWPCDLVVMLNGPIIDNKTRVRLVVVSRPSRIARHAADDAYRDAADVAGRYTYLDAAAF